MNIEKLLKEKIKNSLKKINVKVLIKDIEIVSSKDNSHGDYACNIALKFSKLLKRNPRDIANDIVKNIDYSYLGKIEIAGPGFINFFLSNEVFAATIKEILQKKGRYGQSSHRHKKRINLEFVSANPTGYLHLGHARGAAVGDSLARILSKAGYSVTREYYVNDAGNQINNLGISTFLRYKELFGHHIELSQDMYHGFEIIEVAKKIKHEFNDSLLNISESEAIEICKNKAKNILLDIIKKDLKDFNVRFDVFTFETDIRKNNSIEKEIDYLKRNNLVYEQDGALMLKTSDFLDDKDRVIVKSNGELTYFMPDIVYHLDKLNRGFDYLIDVLGADHHGYINRMKSVLEMHGYSKDVLNVSLIQMVRIFKDGSEMKLSKRTGQTITLRELCEEAGTDAIRYFFVNRSANTHLDFDINLAREQSASNPVYYAQYAYARLNKVLKSSPDCSLDGDYLLLNNPKEIDLMKILGEYYNVIKNAANNLEPYLLTAYIQKLSTCIHAFYSECRIVGNENINLTRSRLALAKASTIVLKNSLNLIGVKVLEKM